MTTKIPDWRLIGFVEQLYEMHEMPIYPGDARSLEDVRERCWRWMDAVLPPPAKEEIEFSDEPPQQTTKQGR
jgi:hypothetical protein